MANFLKLFLLYLFINVSTVQSVNPKFDLAVCAIFQNDAKYLAEWIEFHQEQGVEHFYLYNNLSSDDFKSVLDPYIKCKQVTLIDWPYAQKDLVNWNQIQCRAYIDCIDKISEYVTWCAFIDTDEFLFCPDGSKLTSFLKNFKEYGGVGANWIVYGTSNVYDIPEDKKMTDLLVFRAIDIHEKHLHVKSIVQPKLVRQCQNPHFFNFKNKAFTVTENKVRFDGPFSPTVSVDKIRINHYWSRDRNFFEKVKCARQLKWHLSLDNVIKLEKEFNTVYDPLKNYVK